MFTYNPPLEPWLKIIYEDDHILAVDKPSGLLSVAGRLPEHQDSIATRVQLQYPNAQIVHRLDMSTSGLMLLSKNKYAESALKKQFQYRLTHKIYYARIWGHISNDDGDINLPLICNWEFRPKQKVCFDTGKSAQTLYQVVKREEHSNGVLTSIVRLFPITGRSHQLRVHMQAIGHAIVGDEFYAPDDARNFSSRLELHASELSFYHPKNDWLRSIFVPCEFYHEAQEMIFAYFDPPRKLPNYKQLVLRSN